MHSSSRSGRHCRKTRSGKRGQGAFPSDLAPTSGDSLRQRFDASFDPVGIVKRKTQSHEVFLAAGDRKNAARSKTDFEITRFVEKLPGIYLRRESQPEEIAPGGFLVHDIFREMAHQCTVHHVGSVAKQCAQRLQILRKSGSECTFWHKPRGSSRANNPRRRY